MSKQKAMAALRFLNGTEEVIELQDNFVKGVEDGAVNLSTNGVLVVVATEHLAGRKLADDFLTISKASEDGLNLYTVHLLYPDYMAETFGHDDFLTKVRAVDPLHAFHAAVKEVRESHPDELVDDHDMHILGIYAGDIKDLNPTRYDEPAE